MTGKEVKHKAMEFGADLVGIGDINLFEGTAREKDPRYIAPGARSIIGLGFRVLRGSLRGIEEGTQFYQYPEMGVVHIDEIYAPAVLRRLACFLEDHGFEGVVQRTVPDRRPDSDSGTNPEHNPVHKIKYSEPVSPGKPAPDVLMDFRHAAYICGLGEIGFGGFILTPEYGPFQRFAFILTDALLKPDPVITDLQLCDRCGKCITACPGKAISNKDTVFLEIGKNKIEHARLDEWQCAAYYMGASYSTNPFLAPSALDEIPNGRAIVSGNIKVAEKDVLSVIRPLEDAYPGMRFGYNASICGRACYRDCYVHLEERGVLRKGFLSKFRKKPIWKLNR